MINYQSVLPLSAYIIHMVKIELSGCSMHEPVEVHEINSMMDEAFPQSPFAEAVLGGKQFFRILLFRKNISIA